MTGVPVNNDTDSNTDDTILPTLVELNYLVSTARMIIGIVEARMGYNREQSEQAIEHEGIGEQHSEVCWTEPREIDRPELRFNGAFCVMVGINYQTPDLYGGFWMNTHPVLLTVTLNGHDFFLRPKDTSGTWECSDGDGMERPLNPRLQRFLEDIKLRGMESRVTTGQLVEIILDFLTWRETQ